MARLSSSRACYNEIVTGWTLPSTSPRASAERIRRFLDTYAAAEARHAAEFMPLMQRDDPDESRISSHDFRLDQSLRDIYRIRAESLATSQPSRYYPPGLADDTRDLVVQLDAAKDQPICFWGIAVPSGVDYLVFELLDDHRIVCVKSADQRIVNPRS